MIEVATPELEIDSEWSGPDALDNIIRQGDALLLREHPDQIGQVTYGLVITADCDIVQRKTSGCVSYIPLLSLREYMFRSWIPEHIESRGHSMRCLDGLRKIVFERMKEQIPDPIPLSDTGLFRLAEQEAEEILGLSEDDAKIAKKLRALLSATRSLSVLRERSTPERTLDDLERHATNFLLQSELGNLDRLLSKAADSLKEAVTGSGSFDVFPVSRVAMSDETPHIGLLRFVRSIREDKVTISLGEFKYGDKLACRVGRLRHEVKYELMQRFGRLFLRMGKPDSINEACRTKIDTAMELLGRKTNG